MENSIARVAALMALLLVQEHMAPLAAQVRLTPVDESRRDPSLVAYLDKLRTAVAKQDKATLTPLLDADIQLGFGGEDGMANFRPDWLLLQRLLDLGGAWQDGAFALPYVFAKFPDTFDPFDYAAITGQGVWLRAAATGDARGLRRLSYDIVKVEEQGEAWWRIETLDGERGYVSARFIHSPVGYRAIFTKLRGVWKMTAFLAGD